MVAKLMKNILLCYSKIPQLDVLIDFLQGPISLKTGKETDRFLFAYCCIACSWDWLLIY